MNPICRPNERHRPSKAALARQRVRRGLLAGVVFSTVASGAARPATPPSTPSFYVDSANGSDANDGRSRDTAWKTVAPVNAMVFPPGSHVVFRAGQTFAGPVSLHGSGKRTTLNVVDRCGQGPNPHVAIPAGQGAVLSLLNEECWEVRNLELSGGAIGVFTYLKEFGVAHHLHFKHLDIHDVRGGLTGDDGGFLLKREGLTTWFDDLLIEGCSIKRVDRNGILHTDYPTASDQHHSTHVVIRGNHLRDIGGDGIFILGCDDALIERNVLRYAHQRVGRRPGERACAGIWPHRCNRTIIQLNEVSHTAVGGVTVWDSEAFDDDNSCRDTVFQYNYSHDNAGGFLLLCGGAKGTLVRYNVSQNDAVATFSLEGDGVEDVSIYNNVFYVGPDLTVNMTRNTFGHPRNVRYFNNLFYAEGTMTYNLGAVAETAFEDNAFFGNHPGRPAEAHAVTSDPLLVRPGSGGNGAATAAGYKLKPGSPCRNAGKAVANNGGRDFWGNRVLRDGPPSIGAHNP